MKNLLMVIGGLFLLLVMQVYTLTPVAGAFCIVGGIIGFVVGSPFALRTFLAGLVLLAVKPIVGAIFMKILDRPRP